MRFPLLAAVFLAVTGGEALYADLGHFGTRPIRLGMVRGGAARAGAQLSRAGRVADRGSLGDPQSVFPAGPARRSGFRSRLLATAAAIIASQALISGAFSLTTQAIQLGCLPRFRVRYTSEHSVGQVYVPSVNWMLAVACILLVVSFKTSAALAGAYGIAIALTMAITSVLFFSAARAAWGWSMPKAGARDRVVSRCWTGRFSQRIR